MALHTINDIPLDFFQIVIYVDSKSILTAIKSSTSKERSEIIHDIKYVLHILISRGIDITMCWIPSHCGPLYNEIADQLSRNGSKNKNSIKLI